jgi:soluble lytic murein transglycosylase-like protein
LLWYLLLVLLLLEVAVYGATAVIAGYYHRAVRSDFNAAANVWQEVDKVPYADIINRTARQTGVNARVVAAVVQTESSFQPRALSRAGAAGLMQIIPSTWKQVNQELKVCNGRHSGDCTLDCYFDAELNVRIGSAYLKQLIARYGGDVALALAAYNAGPGSVDRYGGIPPFQETEEYVERVMRNWYTASNKALPLPYLTGRQWDNWHRIIGWVLGVTLLALTLTIRRLLRQYRSWRWR